MCLPPTLFNFYSIILSLQDSSLLYLTLLKVVVQQYCKKRQVLHSHTLNGSIPASKHALEISL